MLNLAEFRGLCRSAVGRLPAIAYFHENQLTYPARQEDPRDLHFAFTNLTTALAADRVWFNSAFHRDSFLTAIDDLVHRMPDYRPLDAAATIRAKASVRSPGIEPALGVESHRPRPAGPLRILWVARWEHDKNPELFFQALTHLLQHGCDFRVSVLGESFDDAPACFAEARRKWAERIDHGGYLPDRRQYWEALEHADVVVSTADHEFFGIAVVEAVAAGCYPVLPNRLAYPELFGVESGCLYDGTLPGLVRRLTELSELLPGGELSLLAEQQAAAMTRFRWPSAARQLDAAVDAILE
jgi:glycosyltransferase involved in cell wall biosynthesis